MTTVPDLGAHLSNLLLAELFANDQNGIYRPSARPVTRLGMALEPPTDVADWVRRDALDALFLHRPWKLGALPQGVGVLAYHYAFDERLTTGYNPYLADALGMAGLEVLGEKEGRPLGMIGDVAPVPFEVFQNLMGREFGGLEAVHSASPRVVSRVCVVGALRPALVHEAADRGAQVYLTGEYRKSAAQAIAETSMSVLVIGHERSERWGLAKLAALLKERFPDLETKVRI